MYPWKKLNFQYECAIKLNEGVHSILKEMILFVPQPYFEFQDTKLCTFMQKGQKFYSTNKLPTSQQPNVQFFSYGRRSFFFPFYVCPMANCKLHHIDACYYVYYGLFFRVPSSINFIRIHLYIVHRHMHFTLWGPPPLYRIHLEYWK